MQIRSTAAKEWNDKVSSIKRKIQVADRMACLEQEPDSRSYWRDYQETLIRRLAIQHHIFVR